LGSWLQIFGPSTRKVTHNKIWPSKIYIVTNINNHGGDQKEDILDE